MNTKAAFSKLALIVCLFSVQPMLTAQSSTQASPCSSSVNRAFDFWVGEWDVFDVDKPDTMAAHARVDLILGDCVLHEDYQQVDGFRGESFSSYDAARKQWHQSWVTNRGSLLMIDGGLQSGDMILSGESHTRDGKTQLVRTTWKLEGKNVRETAVVSHDEGKTWAPLFDMVFRPKTQASGEPPSSDQSTIAALDDRYQAAVKVNDADAMSAILADDFTLVTGSGKTYTKSGLLEEARSGRFAYVHQEDRDRTVRVWGDTAVVTAKLWEEGTESGKPFSYAVWFTDTYLRTPSGWRYVFGQSSLPLPAKE